MGRARTGSGARGRRPESGRLGPAPVRFGGAHPAPVAPIPGLTVRATRPPVVDSRHPSGGELEGEASWESVEPRIPDSVKRPRGELRGAGRGTGPPPEWVRPTAHPHRWPRPHDRGPRDRGRRQWTPQNKGARDECRDEWIYLPTTDDAVTFDLWHTLIYLSPRAEERYVHRQAALAIQVIQASPALPRARPLGATGVRRAFEQERARAALAAEHGRTIDLKEQLTRSAIAAGRKPRPQAYLEALHRELRQTPFRRAPGALPMLQALRDAGYRLGIISNTVGEPGEYLRPVLRSFGIDTLVDATLFSDELPWAKPSARIFLAAMQQLGTRAERSMHVGDGWADLEGARRAGYRATVLFAGLQQYGPSYRRLFATVSSRDLHLHHRVDRLSQVPALADRLLRGRRRGSLSAGSGPARRPHRRSRA